MTRTETQNQISDEIKHGASRAFSFMEEKYMIDNQYPANDVYAIWKPISWTVKYDANGGSGTMADTTHTYNAHIPISNNQFNKAGYTFDGWQASRIRNGKSNGYAAIRTIHG